MLSLLNLSFWLSFLYFLIAIFVAFFIPGDVLLQRIKLSRLAHIILAITLGMALWGWQGFLFGYLHLRWLSYAYLFIFLALWLRRKRYSFFVFKKLKLRIDFIAFFIVTLGVFLQVSTVWLDGVMVKEGLYFCCGQVTDNILMIAYVNQTTNNFPPFEPGMYGTYVQNYHYFGHTIIAELVRVFRLPLVATTYQFFTILLSLLLGLLSVAICQLLKLRIVFLRWFLFFLYLGSDFYFFMMFLFGQDVRTTTVSMENGPMFLLNYPLGFAIVMFFAGLSFLIIWLKKRDMYCGIVMALVFGSLIGIKVYVGIFALIGFGALGVYFLFKRSYKMLLPPTVILILSLILYVPVNGNAGGLFFSGFWRAEDFASTSPIHISQMELARRIYLDHNNWLKVFFYDAIFSVLFILTVFGTKLMAFAQTKKSLSVFPKELHIFFFPAIVVSFLAGFFFLQHSGGANNIFFLITIFIASSLYAALACDYWQVLLAKRKILRYIFIVLVVVLTIPRIIDITLLHLRGEYYRGGYIIGNEEVKALSYMSLYADKDEMVLVDPHIAIDREAPYASFLANRPMYLSGEGNELGSHGIDYAKQDKVKKQIFTAQNVDIEKIMKKNRIKYLYLLSSTKLPSAKKNELKTFYKNSKITILMME